jgi:hypothetical protein
MYSQSFAPCGLQWIALPSWPPPESLPRARHLAHALVGRHRVLRKLPARKALVIAELHAAEVHHAVHHRDFDVLALPGAVRLVQCAEEADREMQPGARVADLGAGDERRAIGHPGRAHRPAHRLGDVFVCLEIRVRTGRAEALDRAHHDLRIDLVDFFPRKTEAIEHPRAEVLHDDVALLEQLDEHCLAFRRLHVDRDRALVAVEHREIQAVRVRDVPQLSSRRVAYRRLEFDYVRPHPREKLRARRSRLHVRHVENANSLECFHSNLQKFCGR